MNDKIYEMKFTILVDPSFVINTLQLVCLNNNLE